jgi:hypothetical protein
MWYHHAGAIGLCLYGEGIDWLLYPIMLRMRIYPEYREDLQQFDSARTAALPPFPAHVFAEIAAKSFVRQMK